MQRDNIRMSQRRNRLQLSVEPIMHPLVMCNIRIHHFNSDRASQPQIIGAIDVPHTAMSEDRINFVSIQQTISRPQPTSISTIRIRPRTRKIG